MLNHILLEVFCMKPADQNADKPLPECCEAENTPGYRCLLHKCPYLDFTSCENTLCYINENSEVEEGILFGGEMESDGDNRENLARWRSIANQAVKDAYEEYMTQKNKGSKRPD